MPFIVQHLLEGRGEPICVRKEEKVSHALSLMIEHDFSQLPVIDTEKHPEGLITYEGILRGIRNFKLSLEQLRVRDVMVNVEVHDRENNLFDMLDRLKVTNAVLIIDPGGFLEGIVTSYDATEYFRSRAENLMRVEDMELMVKEFIRSVFNNEVGEVDTTRLNEAVARIVFPNINRARTFNELTLGQYIRMLENEEVWKVLEPVFDFPQEALIGLLNSVREIRNSLAHFRNDLTSEQEDQLKFCVDWLSRRQEEYEKRQQDALIKRASDEHLVGSYSKLTKIEPVYDVDIVMIAEERQPKDSRYAPLADWLMSRPGSQDRVQLSFEEIEAIIGGQLPNSAYQHRAFWANDSVGHIHSQQWLEAGWRASYINLGEKKITFARVREREKAYIHFFSTFLTDLREEQKMSVKDVSPDGTSWIQIKGVEKGGITFFGCSFARQRRFRVELYIDTEDPQKNKQIFDKLARDSQKFEARLGEISWERIDDKRASRIALYHPGEITDSDQDLDNLRKWAVDTMIRFYQTFSSPVEKAIREVTGG